MSCLFDSVQISIVDETSTSIRNKVCDYLERNHAILPGISTSVLLELDRPNYISEMRKRTTWGGAIEIAVICNIFNICIMVINTRDNKKNTNTTLKFIPINEGIIKNTIYISWDGCHYTPICKK